MLGVELAVACHYLAPNDEVSRFLELVPQHDTTGRRRAVPPLVGETLVVEGDRHWIEESCLMRLVTYEAAGRVGVGVRRGDAVVDTGYADMHDVIRAGAEAARASARRGRRSPTLLAPIRPGKILCSGVNYASHADENPDAVMPTEPFFFSKLPSAVIGPGEPIRIPRETTLADYEVELAMVIGMRGHRIPEERALEHVFGWTILHDVSARDVQFKDSQITLGKNPTRSRRSAPRS